MKTPTTIKELRKALPRMWFNYGLKQVDIYYGFKGNPQGQRTVRVQDISQYYDKPAPRRELIAAAYAAARAVEESDDSLR